MRAEFSPFIGSLSLHNSVARGLHADEQALALLHSEPSPGTAVPSLDAVPSDQSSIMLRSEPTVVHDVTEQWRGTDLWDSEETMIKNFGGVRMDLASDLSMSVVEYLQYDARTTTDFPYYMYEHEYVGDSAKVASAFVAQPWPED